jgi:hypothetical protein
MQRSNGRTTCRIARARGLASVMVRVAVHRMPEVPMAVSVVVVILGGWRHLGTIACLSVDSGPAFVASADCAHHLTSGSPFRIGRRR